MGLNIKNERVHELARRAAAATGMSQTRAIEEALTKLLESLGEDANPQRRIKADVIHNLLLQIDEELVRTTEAEATTIEDL